jgi:hypothetical protein
MKGWFVLLFSFLFWGIPFELKAQEKADTAALKSQLQRIFDRDQNTRTHADSAFYMGRMDSLNLIEVEKIISRYGWPGQSFVGQKGNVTVFLVIQHAELAVQEKYLPLLRASVAKGESRASNLALLEDRIRMRQGKKQIYGSQIHFNKETGAQEFWPIEDEASVNTRRAKMGMQPIEEYAKLFGIVYAPVK